MRILVLVTIVLAIAAGAWVVTGQAPVSASNGKTKVFQGAGETNLNLNDPDNILLLDTRHGRITIQMRPDLAPKHVQRIKVLVRQGFYDGLAFHRVIPSFMAQGGDPAGNGTGGSGIKIPGEFSDIKFERGVVGMARSRGVNSADSQFFIMLGNGRWLDGQYTAWGQVSDGMDAVFAIKKGRANENGKIDGEPDRILRMHIQADSQN